MGVIAAPNLTPIHPFSTPVESTEPKIFIKFEITLNIIQYSKNKINSLLIKIMECYKNTRSIIIINTLLF